MSTSIQAAVGAQDGQPPDEVNRDRHALPERLRMLRGEPTLGTVRTVLREHTRTIVEQQAGARALTMPLAELLPHLNTQTLAVLLWDLEDAPHTGAGALPERVEHIVLHACGAEGEQRIGRHLFAAMVAEYD